MTSVAIDRLTGTGERYFLFIEGGRIDQAHHISNAARALGETIEFANAVQVALDKTKESDTLIIVTADHDQAMVFAGAATRGNPILGVADVTTTTDGRSYTSIFYATGPAGDSPTAGLSNAETTALNYRQFSAFPMEFGEHSPADVQIYARGPGAHLLDGVVEQNYIFHVLMHASRLTTIQSTE